jgi:hypothetical protein
MADESADEKAPGIGQDLERDAPLGYLWGMLVVFVILWGVAAANARPTRLVTNYMEPFCETALGPGWHSISGGPDRFHTWCAMDKP